MVSATKKINILTLVLSGKKNSERFIGLVQILWGKKDITVCANYIKKLVACFVIFLSNLLNKWINECGNTLLSSVDQLF
jgi:hypothetical protein